MERISYLVDCAFMCCWFFVSSELLRVTNDERLIFRGMNLAVYFSIDRHPLPAPVCKQKYYSQWCHYWLLGALIPFTPAHLGPELGAPYKSCTKLQFSERQPNTSAAPFLVCTCTLNSQIGNLPLAGAHVCFWGVQRFTIISVRASCAFFVAICKKHNK